MIDREILNIVLIVAGVGLVAYGRNNSRSVTIRGNNSGDINQNNIYGGGAPSDQKPARGWVEWTGWGCTIGGLVLSAISLWKG